MLIKTEGSELLANKKKKAKGILPCAAWLCNNGYDRLYRCMKTYPELFSHIEQDYQGGRSLNEAVLEAERLEKQYGELPNMQWLQKNKRCRYIAFQMRLHPEVFSHIKQKKMQKTLKEHVIDAEQLEKEHGELPNYRWLRTHGKSGLSCQLGKHPEAFSHIKQTRTQKTLKEHVIDAKQLEKKYGELPCYIWLRDHGRSGLACQIKKHPKVFSHIKQKNMRKTLEEQVAVAEQLEKEYGALPHQYWLRHNGKMGLLGQFVKHPEAFSHIKQKKIKKFPPERWVPIAKKIAKKNDGILPKRKWLQINGLSGLDMCIVRYPELFKGMKQKYRSEIQIIGK